MSTYFNFRYLDLDHEKYPYRDYDGFYSIETRKSNEDLSDPILFNTSNNYLAGEISTKTLGVKCLEVENLEKQ